MADIFISYARQDRERIAQIAAALKTAGFSVWWDRDIHGGAQFSAEIEHELATAGVVVVAWSRDGVISEWVRDEAAFARDNNKLVPIAIDAVTPPLGFRQRQAIDFSTWSGGAGESPVDSLNDAVRRVMSGEAQVAPIVTSSIHAATRRPVLAVILGAIGVGALLIAAFALTGRRETAESSDHIYVKKFDVLGEGEDISPLLERMRMRIIAELGEWGVATVRGEESDAMPQSDFVLAGVVDNSSDELAVNLRLEQTSDRQILWSTDVKTNGLITGVDMLIERVARHVGIVLVCSTSARRMSPEPISAQQFSTLLQICEQETVGDIAEMYEAAAVYLRDAPDSVVGNSMFAMAAAMMADGVARSEEDQKRYRDEARTAGGKAIVEYPENPMAFFALGLAQPSLDWQRREEYFRSAIEYKMPFPHPRIRLTGVQRQVGRNVEAADTMRRVLSATGKFPNNLAGYGWLLAVTGDLAGARSWFDRAREIEPGFRSEYELWTMLFYENPLETLSFFERSASQIGMPQQQLNCYLDLLKVRASQITYSRDTFTDCWRSWYFAARVYASLGDLDAAFDAAEEHFADVRPGNTIFLFYPETDSMRRDPRFWPYVARIGLTEYWLKTDQWPDFCAEPDLPYDCKKAAVTAREK